MNKQRIMHGTIRVTPPLCEEDEEIRSQIKHMPRPPLHEVPMR